MALKASKEHVKEILELFKQGTSELVLTGDARTGKTWMARALSESAVKEGCCSRTLWISLNQIYDEKSLYKTIAHQLSLLPCEDEWEDSVNNKRKEESVENLKQKITAKLDEKTKEKKFLLVVLDCEGEKMTEDGIRNRLGLDAVLNKKPGDFLKVLITTKKNEEREITRETKKVEPLSGKEASNLLKQSLKTKVWASHRYEELSRAIIKRSNVLPDEIIMLAGALNYFALDDLRISGLGHALELALDAAVNVQSQNSLLQYAYDLLPNNCMINCFWHCRHFLDKLNGVNYNELITHWIMEGYLDLAGCMEKAYEMGHHILMEFVDRGMLRMQEDNIIALEAATLDVIDHHCHELSRLANLGLASSLDDEERKVLGNNTPGDSMINTLDGDDKKEELVTSLVIDGSSLSRKIPNEFFQAMQNLKVLAIFNPRLRTFPFSDSNMEKLIVLVLRGSSLLVDCHHIARLNALTVLEISGATYLEEIPDGLFDEVPQLRSLNLSGLGIKFLPTSVSNLIELRRFILRQCCFVEELPKLQKLVKLELLDLSGCTSLTKIEDKCFKTQLKLQVLDFSETKIEKPPIVKFLKDLKRLSLKGCKRLTLLRNLKGLCNLKIVDLSGAVNLGEIRDDCFENTDNLRVLDLSYTKIQCLPSSIGNLCKLLLKGCSLLKSLPEMKGLTRLEVFDLSGCEALCEMPSLENQGNLHELSLKGLSSLTELPSLKSLIHLEIIDLSKTGVVKLPDEITELTHLKRLHLPDLKLIHGVRWKDSKRLGLFWDQCSISESSEILSDTKKPYLVVYSTKFFRELKEDSRLLETTSELFERLIFSIHSSKLQCLDKDDYQHAGELICSDVYFKTRNFPPKENDGECSEFQGFNAFPNNNVGIDIQDILIQTEYISLVENGILRCLSGLKPENLMKIRGCWIERCPAMESIFDETITEIGRKMEILWISTLSNLMVLYNGNKQLLSFNSLRTLSLNYCPVLETIFWSSQLPESLEILQIKHCDGLKTIIGDEESENSSDSSEGLINLRELHIEYCPMIETVFTSVPQNLEILHIKYCKKLQSLFGDKGTDSCLSNLRNVDLFSLPGLTSIGFRLQSSFHKNVILCQKLVIPKIASSEISQNDDQWRSDVVQASYNLSEAAGNEKREISGEKKKKKKARFSFPSLTKLF